MILITVRRSSRMIEKMKPDIYFLSDFAAVLFNPMMIGAALAAGNIPLQIISTGTTFLAVYWLVADMSKLYRSPQPPHNYSHRL